MRIDYNIIEILKKINRTGSLDSKDLKRLSPEEKELIENIYNSGLVKEALIFSESIDSEGSWQEIKTKLKQHTYTKTIPLWKRAYKYAAIFIGIIGLVFFYQEMASSEPENKIVTDSIELILDNGDVQIISASGEKQIINKNGQVIGKQSGDKIDYSSNTAVDKLVYNKLKIPNGRTFNITLSDGTVVYLNSGSSLKYPVKFLNGMKREVFLEGEAYFEVSKDKLHPFIVNASEMNVKVLGTKFNVSSYKNDTEISAVLVEGSVSLSNDLKPKNEAILTPGSKGVLTKSNLESDISLEKVDTSLYTGWIKGDLLFRKSSFNDMAKKLERSYNVKITNHNQLLNTLKFNASFNVNIENIEDVMTALSHIHPFIYKINNRNITITN
ncbi:FecR family protein [Mariniflexile sp. HNIBRBA6329]|uniref:FecR family protein n=1 Tax=Mariniflexile sp. HNIBRBA6329 TaxID=3373088 RepID=UPI00374779E2